MNGNRLGSSGQPRNRGWREGEQIEGLAGVGSGLVGARPPDDAFLRETGITITFELEGHTRTRTIRISSRSAPIRPSASSAPSPELTGNNGFDHDGPRTQNRAADANTVRDAA